MSRATTTRKRSRVFPCRYLRNEYPKRYLVMNGFSQFLNGYSDITIIKYPMKEIFSRYSPKVTPSGYSKIKPYIEYCRRYSDIILKKNVNGYCKNVFSSYSGWFLLFLCCFSGCFGLVHNHRSGPEESWAGHEFHEYPHPDKHPVVPTGIMVDVVNSLGLKLLAIHNENNEDNIAISPYGALSIIVALGEGLQGEAVRELQKAAHIPNDIAIIRVGLRDIHRHLKSYFIPKEGFLAGLTLNHDNVTLRPEYEEILRFYGFDIMSFNNALYPDPLPTEYPFMTKPDEPGREMTMEMTLPTTVTTLRQPKTDTTLTESTTAISSTTEPATTTAIETTSVTTTTKPPETTTTKPPETTTIITTVSTTPEPTTTTQETTLTTTVGTSTKPPETTTIITTVSTTPEPTKTTQETTLTTTVGTSTKPPETTTIITTVSTTPEPTKTTQETTLTTTVGTSTKPPETTTIITTVSTTPEPTKTTQETTLTTTVGTSTKPPETTTIITTVSTTAEPTTTTQETTLTTTVGTTQTATSGIVTGESLMSSTTEEGTTTAEETVKSTREVQSTTEEATTMKFTTTKQDDTTTTVDSTISSTTERSETNQIPESTTEFISTTTVAQEETVTTEKVEITTTQTEVSSTVTDENNSQHVMTSTLITTTSELVTEADTTVSTTTETTNPTTTTETTVTQIANQPETTTETVPTVTTLIETSTTEGAPRETIASEPPAGEASLTESITPEISTTEVVATETTVSERSTIETLDETFSLEETAESTIETTTLLSFPYPDASTPELDSSKEVITENEIGTNEADTTIVKRRIRSKKRQVELNSSRMKPNLRKPLAADDYKISYTENEATSTKIKSKIEPLKESPFRKSRSVVDYVIARYYDNYYPQHDHHLAPYVPQTQPSFLIQGKYRETQIDFMKYDTLLPFFYVANLRAMALSFPLDSPKYYLLLLLPVNENGIDKLICELRLNGSFKYIIDNLRYRHVVALIPSFMLKGYVNLTPTLQKLGIRRVFEPRQADFSPMTSFKELYITSIEQAITVNIRNYVDPDTLHNRREFRQEEPVEFRADHPFLYFVIDTDIHVALMAGKIVNPLNTRIT